MTFIHKKARMAGRKNIGLITCLAVAGMLSSCALYRPQPIDLNRETAEWARLSAELCGGRHSLSIPEIRRIGLLLNPELNQARLTHARSTSVAEFAGLWEDPSLSAEVERVLQEHLTNGAISPSLSIPVTGIPAISKRIAEQYKEADYWNMREKERAYLAALDTLCTKVQVTHVKLDVLRARLKQAEQEKDKVSELYRLGEVSFADYQVITRRVSDLLREVQEMESEHLSQHLELVKQMGLHPSVRQMEVTEYLARGVPSMVAAPTAEQLLESPALKAQLASYGAGEEELRREIRKQYPQLELGFTYAHDDGNDKVAPGISFNLPLWNRNREAIARSTGDRSLKKQETLTVWRELLTQAAALKDRGALAERHCREELARTRALAEAVEHQQKLYDMGEIQLPELADARQEHFTRRMSYLDCLSNLLEIRTQLQYLNPQFTEKQ